MFANRPGRTSANQAYVGSQLVGVDSTTGSLDPESRTVAGKIAAAALFICK